MRTGMQEWQLADSRRDSTHGFEGDDYECLQCGKPRCFHVEDGFVPTPSPGLLGQDATGHFSIDPNVKYRGPHPRFSKLGKPLAIKKEEYTSKGLAALRRSEPR